MGSVATYVFIGFHKDKKKRVSYEIEGINICIYFGSYAIS